MSYIPNAAHQVLNGKHVYIQSIARTIPIDLGSIF